MVDRIFEFLVFVYEIYEQYLGSIQTMRYNYIRVILERVVLRFHCRWFSAVLL